MSVAVGPQQAAGPPSEDGRPAGPTPEEIKLPVLENVDRAITGVITAVPPLLLVIVGWQAWDSALHWRDIVIFLIMYMPDRARCHDRLSPPAHAPQLQDLAMDAGAARDPRHDVGRGSRDLVGGRPPQAPRLLRPPRRSAQPSRRPRRRWKGALRGLGHAHVGWLFNHTQRGVARALRAGPDGRPGVSFVDGRSCCGRWWASRSRSASAC